MISKMILSTPSYKMHRFLSIFRRTVPYPSHTQNPAQTHLPEGVWWPEVRSQMDSEASPRPSTTSTRMLDRNTSLPGFSFMVYMCPALEGCLVNAVLKHQRCKKLDLEKIKSIGCADISALHVQIQHV